MRREKLFTRINKADAWLKVIGLGFVTPLLRITAGDNPKAQGKLLWQLLGVPLLAIAAFLLLWGTLAPRVQTSLGAIPGPDGYSGLLQGDWGWSFEFDQPVSEVLGDTLWLTVLVNLAAMLFIYAVSLPLGTLAAVRAGGPV